MNVSSILNVTNSVELQPNSSLVIGDRAVLVAVNVNSTQSSLIVMGSVVIVSQNATFKNATLSIVNGNVTFGSLLLDPTSTLVLSNATVFAQKATLNGTLVIIVSEALTTVLSFGDSVVGNFSNVIAVSSNPCLAVVSSSLGFTSTSASLSVAFTPRTCNSGNALSTGTIVGISIGCVVFATVVFVVFGVFVNKQKKKRDLRANAKLRSNTVLELQKEIEIMRQREIYI